MLCVLSSGLQAKRNSCKMQSRFCLLDLKTKKTKKLGESETSIYSWTELGKSLCDAILFISLNGIAVIVLADSQGIMV